MCLMFLDCSIMRSRRCGTEGEIEQANTETGTVVYTFIHSSYDDTTCSVFSPYNSPSQGSGDKVFDKQK